MTDTNLQKSLDGHEGFKPEPYLDTQSLWTFGKGHCLERNPLNVFEWKFLLDRKMIRVEITESGADYLRDERLRDIIQRLTMQLPNWARITSARQNALVEMCYQLGPGILDASSPKCWPRFTQAVKDDAWSDAKAHALDSDWARVQTPRRAKELADILEKG